VAEYVWVPQDGAGNDLSPSPPFSSQDDAEAWMGREWSGLVDAGAEYVVLKADGEFVYRMGLRAG
jgi:hypothetical protein